MKYELIWNKKYHLISVSPLGSPPWLAAHQYWFAGSDVIRMLQNAFSHVIKWPLDIYKQIIVWNINSVRQTKIIIYWLLMKPWKRESVLDFHIVWINAISLSGNLENPLLKSRPQNNNMTCASWKCGAEETWVLKSQAKEPLWGSTGGNHSVQWQIFKWQIFKEQRFQSIWENLLSKSRPQNNNMTCASWICVAEETWELKSQRASLGKYRWKSFSMFPYISWMQRI